MSTTLAKVAYNNVIRQISLSAEESTSPELLWSKLQDDLRRVHGIPVGSSFYLTYTDEDGDTITLDTGVELLELVRNTTRSIRFELILREVAAGITESSSVPVSTEPVTYPAATEPGESTEEAIAPPQSEKNKPEEQEKPSEKSQPEPSPSSSSSSSTGRSGPSNNNDPISSLLESIQPLLSSLSSNPEILRDIIGNIGEQAAAHIEPFIQNLNESICQQQTAASSSTTSGTENTETPFAGGRCGPGAARGWGGPGAHPWGAGFGHPWAQAFANSGHPWAQAFRNAQEQYFQQQQGETSQDAPTQTLSDEQVNEKLASLQGLGLGWDNVERTKELLRRYEGNVDRVAEVLLREQE